VNIEKFDYKYACGQISWTEKRAAIGTAMVRFLLPSTQDRTVDLSGAEILNFWWVSDKVASASNHFVWWGAIKNEVGPKERYYPLILELPQTEMHILGKFYRLVETSPGRPGNPSTILVDKTGEVVPNLYFSPGSQVKVLFLCRDWESMGWDRKYPAIALQFLESKYTKSKGELESWQAYMLRNKA